MLTILATVAYLATVAITCIKTDYFEEPDNRAWVAAPVTLLGLLLLVFDRNRPSDSRTVYGLGLITCGKLHDACDVHLNQLFIKASPITSSIMVIL